MIEGEPSHTAIYVAAMRAAHLRFDPPPHLLDDELAAALLGAEHEPLIESVADGAHWVLLENRLFVPLRARWVEDRLRAAYRAGVRQYVILGAGLDSFSFRQPAELGELQIFEVDHPNTQQWKRDRIRSLGWSVPHNVTFTECDFERTSISDALKRASFHSDEPALVSWMGVIYYLARPSARQALAALNSTLTAGSEVVLDYLVPYEDLSPRYLALTETSGQYLKRVGEPHVNKLRPAELEKDILEAGFSGAILESRGDIFERYLATRASEIPLSERFGLAVAVK
ncbi:MAG: class I SAM-dependent methyltransferase [Deltaproteobacteria bacterium]|nr:class I SAM-dependent methyltransferase [Deltaproteobacteria bacterium]MBW2418980.1 class I SAM-dependent methyltransferase [Deltaproteobacteria bacterium]